MNDHDAMDAINAVLNRLLKVCYISGQNAIDHEAVK